MNYVNSWFYTHPLMYAATVFSWLEKNAGFGINLDEKHYLKIYAV